MELIGIERSRIVSLFLVSNQAGQPPLINMATALVHRYEFATFPSNIEDLLKDKHEFGQGIFDGHRIDLVEVFGDGIVVTARSRSDVIDRFIDDLREWAANEFGLKSVETHAINRIYESHLIVRSEKNILGVLNGLNIVRATIQKLLKKSTRIEADLQSFGISFAADNTTIAGLRPSSFRLERKAEASYEKNLYYSLAPLQTEDHLSVLEQIESLS